MAAAWLLTLLALSGVFAGLLLGQSRTLSSHLGAAGGGLLFGIALFWIIPEIAETTKWAGAFALALAACGALAGLDRLLMHTGHSPRHGVLGPLLAAAAIHSFLDGWSVRALSGHPLTNVAVPVGLALHKVPEGLALGWIARRTVPSHWKAALAGSSVEILTVVGALIEPRANTAGAATFGPWWSATVLAVIAGGFLFLGLHAVLPNWRRLGVVAVFVVTLLLVGMIRE